MIKIDYIKKVTNDELSAILRSIKIGLSGTERKYLEEAADRLEELPITVESGKLLVNMELKLKELEKRLEVLEQEPCNEEVLDITGHWINKDFRKEEYVLVGKCSVCGQVRVIDEFCSHCGARMESEDKE